MLSCNFGNYLIKRQSETGADLGGTGGTCLPPVFFPRKQFRTSKKYKNIT